MEKFNCSDEIQSLRLSLLDAIFGLAMATKVKPKQFSKHMDSEKVVDYAIKFREELVKPKPEPKPKAKKKAKKTTPRKK